MDIREFSSRIESRIYIADVHYQTIRCLCYDAREWGMHSVQVFPNMVHLCTPDPKGYRCEGDGAQRVVL